MGLTEREIEKELKNANVANYQDVMKGIFRPIEVDRDLVTQSRIGKIGVPQPIYKGMFDMARKGLTQDLTGKFLTPDIRAKERAAKERAREALRIYLSPTHILDRLCQPHQTYRQLPLFD